ncbi:MAG: flagellar filament capping protein FliD, partial [Planctomycetota bacterium]
KLHSIFIPTHWDSDPDAPEIQILSQMGISFENNGTLTMTDVDVVSAIEDNFDEVKNLFTTTGTGFARQVDTFLEDYTKYEGFLDSKKHSFEDIVKDFDKQIVKAEARLDSYEAMLIKKYAALESLMSGLQAQQSVLTYSQNWKTD